MKYSLLKLSALAAIIDPMCEASDRHLLTHAGFHRESSVLTSGGRRQVDEIEVGDYVHAYSTLTTAMGKAAVLDKALGRPSRLIMEIDLGDRTIKATPHQRFFDVNKHHFIRACDLTTENILLGEDGSLVNIMGIQKRLRGLLGCAHEITIGHKDHAFFVDGVLCHNMDDAMGFVGKTMVTEGLKKGVIGAMSAPVSAGIGAALMVTAHAAKQINQPGHEMVKDSFSEIDHDLPPSMRNDLLPPPPAVIEVRPGGAPQSDAAAKRQVNHANVEKFRRANAERNNLAKMSRTFSMVQPGPSTGPRAVIQIPYMGGPQRPYPGSAEAIEFEKRERARQERAKDPRRDWEIERDERKALKAEQERQKMQEISDKANGILKAEKEFKEQRAQRAADKRAADKAQMEGRWAAIQASGAKTEEERRAAVRSYDEGKMFAPIHPVEVQAPAEPVRRVISATPEEIESLNKMFGLQPGGFASALRLSQQHAELNAARPGAAPSPMELPGFNKPVTPQVMESVNKAIANVSRPVPAPRILALPPVIGMRVLTKTQYQAEENNRASELANHQESMRRTKAQQVFDDARNAESSHKGRSAEKTRLQREDMLKERLLAMSKTRK